jgi:uncharacterized membrane-anchored protein YhcB (DUF1043 family)
MIDTPTDMFKNETVVGIIIAGVGAALVRWMDRSLQQKTIVHDESEKLRVEFRELNELLQQQIENNQQQIATLMKKIDDMEKDLVLWKDKYYALLASITNDREK